MTIVVHTELDKVQQWYHARLPLVAGVAGPPTHHEIETYYPAKFTWEQLKLFINSGDLTLLKRHKKLQIRYKKWSEGIKMTYGSVVNYLLEYRLQWGKPDTLSLLPSQLDDYFPETPYPISCTTQHPNYFTADIPRDLLSIIQNDWPYSVPLDIEHTLIWTKLPILPPPTFLMPHIAESLTPELQEKVAARLVHDGLWGFTGSLEPPPSPVLLPYSLGALTSEYGVTLDKLVVNPRGSDEEERAVQMAGSEVQKFIERRWNQREWETCWIVNPPRLQSVKGLAHIHVFARKKSAEESDRWDMMFQG